MTESMVDTSRAVLLTEADEYALIEADPEARTVRQVLIRAGTSKNRRVYSEAVLQKALALFEGVKTYANHATKTDNKERPERSVRELTGWIENVVYTDGKLTGTRHFVNTAAGRDVWALVEQVITGRAPHSLIGASINAVGRARAEKNTDGSELLIIESIDSVTSVDDVTSPAAGGGFALTASDNGDTARALVGSMTFEEWTGSRPEFVERLKREWKVVRLADETKRALAVSDEHVKAVEARMQDAEKRLTEAEDALKRAIAERDKAQKALAIHEALMGVAIPSEWRDDLKKRLTEAEPANWPAIVAAEQSKAKRVARPPLPGLGAPRQVDTAPIVRAVSADVTVREVLPKPTENVEQWAERVDRISGGR